MRLLVDAALFNAFDEVDFVELDRDLLVLHG
jgi:hypothetical protein